jgi:hypothetical protein
MPPSRGARLSVEIVGDSRGLHKATRDASGALDRLGKQTTLTGRITSRGFSAIGLAARGMAAGVVAGGASVGFLVKQYEESNKIGRQTQAVLKSTGGAANVSAKQVSDLATAISRKTGVDDEAIQSGENLLLTFTKVRNETGKGNDIFSRATQTITDMSVALGQDTKNSAIQLGKALNDPIKGVTALRRVGVSFTQQQQDQIKTLVDSGKQLDAQKLILKELNTEFGGSAAAQATGFDKLKTSAGNLAESVGGVLAPALDTVSTKLSHVIDNITDGRGPIAGFLGSLGHIPGKVADAFDKIKNDPRGPGAAIGAMIVAGIDSINFRAIGKKVSAGLQKGLDLAAAIGANIVAAIAQVPWGDVGRKISAGFDTALSLGDQLPAQIAAGLSQAVSRVNGRQVLGKLVDIIGEAIDALFSPSFWAEHWKGILAGITLVIPVGRLLKIPGFATLYRFISAPVFKAVGAMGRGLVTLFSKGAAEAGVSFLARLETIAPRTANLLLKVVTGGARTLARLPGRLAGIAGDAATAVVKRLGAAVGDVAGRVLGWINAADKVLGRGVQKFADGGVGLVKGLLGKLDDLAHNVPSTIAKALGNGVRKMGDWVKDFGASGAAMGAAIVTGIRGALSGLAGTVGGLVNAVIDIINKIPGVHIGHVSWGGGGGRGRGATARDLRAAGFARGGIAERGGKVTAPIIMMGEEAPTHPEWVIPENPAYRKRAIDLWAQAGEADRRVREGWRGPGLRARRAR